MKTSTYSHALKIWLEERLDPPWRRYLQPWLFELLVADAEVAGWRFTSRTRLEQTLKTLLKEGD